MRSMQLYIFSQNIKTMYSYFTIQCCKYAQPNLNATQRRRGGGAPLPLKILVFFVGLEDQSRIATKAAPSTGNCIAQ